MLTTINGKEYGYFYRGTSTYKAVEKLIELCETGSPREVLAQVEACGFDSRILKVPFLVREASPIPVHPMADPFRAACFASNLPVVRLMLELGADPDAKWHQTTIRQKYASYSQVTELFEGGKCWWKFEYSDDKKQALLGELERSILAGEVSEAIWFMAHGVRLASPAILASKEFSNQSPTFKELVFRMGVPDNRLNEFHAWLKENCANADVLDVWDALLQSNGDEGQDFAEKLLLSVGLIDDNILDEVAARDFSLHTQVSMLRYFISNYDASKQQPFIEKTVATLFRNILCRLYQSR
ncbi:MAG: hypothetical protein IKR81_06010 [Victivallales bacterium]|nr:hypothetical protein [Victivallales bacterium]